MPSVSVTDALLSAAQGLRANPDTRTIERVRSQLRLIADSLDALGNSAVSHKQEWGEIAEAIAALTAAASLRPAIEALDTTAHTAPDQAETRHVLVALAVPILAKALAHATPLRPVILPQRVSEETLALPERPLGRQKPDLASLRAMENIARFHREHERFYSVTLLEQAARLAREAARLKVLAGHWLQPAAPVAAIPGVDFTQAAYRAVGCEDLNALPSIASIGILFMEGQGEPAEIGILKATLGGSSAAAVQSGKWLAEMMAAAWDRESSLLSWGNATAAEARFRTIAANWIGAQETVLVGRLMALTRDLLSQIDFHPEAIRSQRAASGEAVLKAARVLDAAARLQGRCGIDLAGNDEPWTVYGVFLQQQLAGENS